MIYFVKAKMKVLMTLTFSDLDHPKDFKHCYLD